MSELSLRILQRRRELGLSQEELARRMGYRSKSSITKLEKGVNDIPQAKIEELAAALDTTPAWLLGLEPVSPAPPPGFEPLPGMKTVPLIGPTAAAGLPITDAQNVVCEIQVPAVWDADFALTCCGDSMAPFLRDGDIVCIRIQSDVENGGVAAVRIGQEIVLRRIYRQGDVVTLTADNTAVCPPMVCMGPALNEIRIEGRAAGFCRGL